MALVGAPLVPFKPLSRRWWGRTRKVQKGVQGEEYSMIVLPYVVNLLGFAVALIWFSRKMQICPTDNLRSLSHLPPRHDSASALCDGISSWSKASFVAYITKLPAYRWFQFMIYTVSVCDQHMQPYDLNGFSL